MYTLHAVAQSGNAYKVALLLQALGVPWQPRHVDFFAGATREPAWRAEHNAMGEVPVLDVPADGHRPARSLTQSGAILTWLAERHGAYGDADADERLEVLRWLLFDNHKFTSYLAAYRFLRSFAPTAPDPAVLAFLKGRIDAAYAIVEQHLSRRDWLVGDGPTIADCSLAGYVFYPAEETGLDLPTTHPAIDAWRGRLRGLPGWADPYALLPGERIAPKWV